MLCMRVGMHLPISSVFQLELETIRGRAVKIADILDSIYWPSMTVFQ